MRFFRLSLLLTISTLLTHAALAQSRVSGVVQDSVTHEPLAFASVFMANTTLGATTDDKGAFVFERVPAGNYSLVGSYVGYRLGKQVLVVARTPQTVTLALASDGGAKLEEVVVQANPHAADDYRRFSGLFLGQSSFSQLSRITNPGDVDVAYSDSTKTLTASTDKFVQVENAALGYRIKYYGLRFDFDDSDGSTSFYGEPVFEEMTPRDATQRQLWADNRAAAYRGSLPHFLRSVYQNRVAQENFLAQQIRRNRAGKPILYPAARPIDSLRRVGADGRVYLRFTGELQVSHFGEAPDPRYEPDMAALGNVKGSYPSRRETSRLKLADPEVAIYSTGTVADPLSLLVGEYWGFEKIGELRPLDYVPPTGGASASTAGQ